MSSLPRPASPFVWPRQGEAHKPNHGFDRIPRGHLIQLLPFLEDVSGPEAALDLLETEPKTGPGFLLSLYLSPSSIPVSGHVRSAYSPLPPPGGLPSQHGNPSPAAPMTAQACGILKSTSPGRQARRPHLGHAQQTQQLWPCPQTGTQAAGPDDHSTSARPTSWPGPSLVGKGQKRPSTFSTNQADRKSSTGLSDSA